MLPPKVLDGLVFPLLSLLAFGGFQTSLQLAKDDDEQDKGMGQIYATLFIHSAPTVMAVSLVAIWLPLYEAFPLWLHVTVCLLPALVLVLFLANLMTFEVGRGQVIRSARALLNRGRGHIFNSSAVAGDGQSVSSLGRTNGWEWWENFRSKKKREDLTVNEEVATRVGSKRCSAASPQPDASEPHDQTGQPHQPHKHDIWQKPVEQVNIIEPEEIEPELNVALPAAALSDQQLRSPEHWSDAQLHATLPFPTHVDTLQVERPVPSRTQTLSSVAGSVLLERRRAHSLEPDAPSLWRTLTECPRRAAVKWIDTWARPLDCGAGHGSEESEIISSTYQKGEWSAPATCGRFDQWTAPPGAQNRVEDVEQRGQPRLPAVIRNSACFLVVFLPVIAARMTLFAVVYATLTPLLVLVFCVFFPVASVLCSVLHLWEAVSHSATQTSSFHVLYTPSTIFVWLASSVVAVLVAPTLMCGLWLLGIAVWGGWRSIPVVGQLEADMIAGEGNLDAADAKADGAAPERRKTDSAQFTCAASSRLESKTSGGRCADRRALNRRAREDGEEDERAVKVMFLPDVPPPAAPPRSAPCSCCPAGQTGDSVPGGPAGYLDPEAESSGAAVARDRPAGLEGTASSPCADGGPSGTHPLVVDHAGGGGGGGDGRRPRAQSRRSSSSSSSAVRRSRRAFWVTPRLRRPPRPFREVVAESCRLIAEDVRRQKLFIFG